MEGQIEDGVHPLLLPSVVTVLVEHLKSLDDILNARLVCKVWWRTMRNRSPLLNPRVIYTILKHLPDSSIPPFRLVCSLWNQIVVNSFRWNKQDDPTYMNFESTFWSSCFRAFEVGASDFKRFSSKFGDPENLPMPLAFNHFYAWNNISLGDPDTVRFLDTYGRCLKSVELYRCKWDLEDLRHLLFHSCVNLERLKVTCGVLPGTQVQRGRKITILDLDVVLLENPGDPPVLRKLKTFHVDMNILDSKDRVRAYVEQFFVEFFEVAPNLEVINFDFSSWYARSWATNFIASCEAVKLEHVRVLEHLVDPDLEGVLNLTKKGFPLSKLRIRIRYKDVTVGALHDLLRSLSGTLTDLQIVFYDYGCACAHEFPSSSELSKLRRLELWRFKGQLGFLRDFGGLEELVIGEMELKGQEVFKGRGVFREVMPSVRVTFKDDWEVRVFS